MIYTVMWKGQLVRINLKNRTAEILLKKISNVATGDGGKAGSDSYIAFSPIKGEEKRTLCISCRFSPDLESGRIQDHSGR